MIRTSWIISCTIATNRGLQDLVVVVVAARQLRRAAGDAAFGEIADLRPLGHALRRGPDCRRTLLALGQRRNPAVRRLDDQ